MRRPTPDGDPKARHIFDAVLIRVNVRIFYQLVDTGERPWPTRNWPCDGNLPGRAARGSVVPRKMACRLARGESLLAVQGHQCALRRGSLVAALSNWEQHDWRHSARQLGLPRCTRCKERPRKRGHTRRGSHRRLSASPSGSAWPAKSWERRPGTFPAEMSKTILHPMRRPVCSMHD
jgi:hypothetical protein